MRVLNKGIFAIILDFRLTKSLKSIDSETLDLNFERGKNRTLL